jgi:hypothetical protein
MAKPESEFPTIRDVHARLAELVEQGLGDHPCQVLIVPDSTMQAIARASGAPMDGKPALMIELSGETGRMPVTITSTDRWLGGGMNINPQ